MSLEEIFRPLLARDRFVVGQLGLSLDGRIATESGHSHYINGSEDIRRLHGLRAIVDAVIVGAGTVAADNPRLTVREVEGDDPVRVVLDPSGRLDTRRSVFTDGAAPTLWVRDDAEGGSPSRADGGSPGLDEGVEIVRLEVFGDTGFRPADVLAMLARRGLVRVLVEGGGITVSRFLEAGALDRLHLSVAPLLLGSGRPAITLPPIGSLDEAIRPPVRHFPLGDDLLFDLDLGPTKA